MGKCKRYCDCYDTYCPVHRGENCKDIEATVVLFRIDMEDYSGSYFCDVCAEDAMSTGLFREKMGDCTNE